jgi:ADP-ribose pyrophosphatase
MEPWKVLSGKVILDCWPWLRVHREHVRLPNGHEIDDYYRVDLPEWAQVFALTEDGHVAMIEHYKHGAGINSLELPAGYLEAGEPPESAARRELLEETGLEASDWRYLGRYFIDGNRGCGAAYIFLARHARQVVPPNLEISESMVQRRLTLAEVREVWLNGHFHNMSTVGAVGLALAILEEENGRSTSGAGR